MQNNLQWIKVYFSPFKFFLPRLYIGKINIGTPYFYPRKWVKYTEKDCIKHAKKDINNPSSIFYNKSINEVKKYYKGYSKSINKIIGFDFVSLGYKTKWNDWDIRFEWSPIWSFVFFKWQIALIFNPKIKYYDHYWECYLAYSHTDKKLSTKDRIKEARKNFPCRWGTKTDIIDYWNLVLSKKYITL